MLSVKSKHEAKPNLTREQQ